MLLKAGILGLPKPESGDLKRTTPGTWKAVIADTDSRAIARIGKCVRALGYEAERVRSADEIVPALHGRTRAVVIASLALPALDAARLCRDVRTTTHNAYVILLLGDRARQSIERAFDAGADDVISKPIVEAELRARVRLAGRVVALEEYGNRIQGEATLLAELAVNASLHSRRYLEVELGRELDRARRFSHPIGVLLAQAHPANLGERVLRSYGKFLCGHLRTRVDWVARYEERSFAVVLPETTLDGASRVAMRLQAALRRDDVTSGGLPDNLQANIGVSAFDRASTMDAPSAQSLLAGAEAQLQSATRDGLGRIATAYPQQRH